MMTCKSLIMDMLVKAIFHYREVVLFQRLLFVQCYFRLSLNRDLSTFGVSFIRGSTVSNNKSIVILQFVARYTIAYSMNRILQMKSS